MKNMAYLSIVVYLHLPATAYAICTIFYKADSRLIASSILNSAHMIQLSLDPRRDLDLPSAPVHERNAISPSNTLMPSAILPNIINVNISKPKLPPSSLNLLDGSQLRRFLRSNSCPLLLYLLIPISLSLLDLFPRHARLEVLVHKRQFWVWYSVIGRE